MTQKKVIDAVLIDEPISIIYLDYLILKSEDLLKLKVPITDYGILYDYRYAVNHGDIETIKFLRKELVRIDREIGIPNSWGSYIKDVDWNVLMPIATKSRISLMPDGWFDDRGTNTLGYTAHYDNAENNNDQTAAFDKDPILAVKRCLIKKAVKENKLRR